MKDQATINVRLSASLKKRGDEVLKRSGVSPTQAIRALWEEMARTRMVPDFILQEAHQGEDEERQRKMAALRGLDGLALDKPQHLSGKKKRMAVDGQAAVER